MILNSIIRIAGLSLSYNFKSFKIGKKALEQKFILAFFVIRSLSIHSKTHLK